MLQEGHIQSQDNIVVDKQENINWRL